MNQILDGRALAQQLKDQLKGEVAQIHASTGQVPRIVNLIVGSDPGSCVYAKSQKKVADYIGIDYQLKTVREDIQQSEFCTLVESFNHDDTVNGIMIHKPLPAHLDYRVIANFVDMKKDLEGINVANIGKMTIGDTALIPCTPAAVMQLLQATQVNLRGKEVVIVGHSVIVGKPLSLLLLQKNATVTVCHVATSEAGKLDEHVRRADVVIVAVGKPAVVKGEWIKPGAIVIDVGINQVDGAIVGDVEFEQALQHASFITPVPGGVGPVTVVMLMFNALEAYKMQTQKV